MAGYHSQRNPFDIDSKEREEWYLGWKAADEDPEAPDVDPDLGAEPVAAEPEPDVETPPQDDEPARDQFEAGQEAALRGDGPDDNPNDGGTDAHSRWVEGYNAARSEIEQLIEEGAAAARKGDPKKSCPWKKKSDGERFWLEGWEKGMAAIEQSEDVAAEGVSPDVDGDDQGDAED